MVLTYQSELFCANNFLQKSYYHKKKFFCSLIVSESIFSIIWTCLTNLESLECLLFADLNDFTQTLAEFV